MTDKDLIFEAALRAAAVEVWQNERKKQRKKVKMIISSIAAAAVIGIILMSPVMINTIKNNGVSNISNTENISSYNMNNYIPSEESNDQAVTAVPLKFDKLPDNWNAEIIDSVSIVKTIRLYTEDSEIIIYAEPIGKVSVYTENNNDDSVRIYTFTEPDEGQMFMKDGYIYSITTENISDDELSEVLESLDFSKLQW